MTSVSFSRLKQLGNGHLAALLRSLVEAIILGNGAAPRQRAALLGDSLEVGAQLRSLPRADCCGPHGNPWTRRESGCQRQVARNLMLPVRARWKSAAFFARRESNSECHHSHRSPRYRARASIDGAGGAPNHAKAGARLASPDPATPRKRAACTWASETQIFDSAPRRVWR